MRRLFVLVALAPLTASAASGKTDPVTGEQAESKSKERPSEAPKAAPAEGKKEEAAPQPAPNEPQKIDPKSFDKALESYFLGYPKDAAGPLFAYTEGMPQT